MNEHVQSMVVAELTDQYEEQPAPKEDEEALIPQLAVGGY